MGIQSVPAGKLGGHKYLFPLQTTLTDRHASFRPCTGRSLSHRRNRSGYKLTRFRMLAQCLHTHSLSLYILRIISWTYRHGQIQRQWLGPPGQWEIVHCLFSKCQMQYWVFYALDHRSMNPQLLDPHIKCANHRSR